MIADYLSIKLSRSGTEMTPFLDSITYGRPDGHIGVILTFKTAENRTHFVENLSKAHVMVDGQKLQVASSMLHTDPCVITLFGTLEGGVHQ